MVVFFRVIKRTRNTHSIKINEKEVDDMKKQLVKEENGIRHFNNGDFVDLRNIPKLSNGYDWKNSSNCTFQVMCNGIHYDILILEYIGKQLLKIKCNDFIREFRTCDILTCKFSHSLVENYYNHKYEVEEIVNGMKILNQIRIENKYGRQVKGYICECICDGNIEEKLETKLDVGHGCCVCTSKKVVKNINSIWKTHNHLVKYFEDENVSYTHSYNSNKKANLKCPDCGEIVNMRICDFVRRGLSCKRCSDRISMPNKFIYSLLTELNVDFVTELSKTTFEWCGKYRYDFYLPKHNTIIEADGGWHTKNNNMSGKTALESITTDLIKDGLALSNGVYVIRIDCDYKNNNIFEYMINSIKNSYLSKMFSLESIDINKCIEMACSNNIKKACNFYNEGLLIQEIYTKMKLSYSTILSYLHTGKKLGWCDYTPQKYRLERLNMIGTKSVNWKDFVLKIDMKSMEIVKTFETSTQARKEKGFTGVGNVLLNKQEHIQGYIFMYQKDWFALQKQLYNLA